MGTHPSKVQGNDNTIRQNPKKIIIINQQKLGENSIQIGPMTTK
jgi:hypothetical protein